VYCWCKKPTVSLIEDFQLAGAVFNIVMLLTCSNNIPKKNSVAMELIVQLTTTVRLNKAK
jgi:hypothetical protein